MHCGIANSSASCWLNTAIQCLYGINEVHNFANSFTALVRSSDVIALATKNLFIAYDTAACSSVVTPLQSSAASTFLQGYNYIRDIVVASYPNVLCKRYDISQQHEVYDFLNDYLELAQLTYISRVVVPEYDSNGTELMGSRVIHVITWPLHGYTIGEFEQAIICDINNHIVAETSEYLILQHNGNINLLPHEVNVLGRPYTLQTVVWHVGADFGHYFCECARSDEWYCFNDDNDGPVSAPQINRYSGAHVAVTIYKLL